MRSTQVTTWPRYTQAEKKAYRARELKRRQTRRALKDRVFADLYSGRVPDEEAMRALGWTPDPIGRPGGPDGFKTFGTITGRLPRPHHFADNQGSRVPTISPKGDVL